MILKKGHWLGKGSWLVEGASLGQDASADVQVTEDQTGMTLQGHLMAGGEHAVSIRVAPNDVGTYTVDARLGKLSLAGTAKLESEPNLALLWVEAQAGSAHACFVSVALFVVPGGFGCRGFVRDGNPGEQSTRTWELAFKLKHQVVGGPNVVSLANRRRH